MSARNSPNLSCANNTRFSFSSPMDDHRPLYAI